MGNASTGVSRGSARACRRPARETTSGASSLGLRAPGLAARHGDRRPTPRLLQWTRARLGLIIVLARRGPTSPNPAPGRIALDEAWSHGRGERETIRPASCRSQPRAGSCPVCGAGRRALLRAAGRRRAVLRRRVGTVVFTNLPTGPGPSRSLDTPPRPRCARPTGINRTSGDIYVRSSAVAVELARPELTGVAPSSPLRSARDAPRAPRSVSSSGDGAPVRCATPSPAREPGGGSRTCASSGRFCGDLIWPSRLHRVRGRAAPRRGGRPTVRR